jgi:hypothetical protein
MGVSYVVDGKGQEEKVIAAAMGNLLIGFYYLSFQVRFTFSSLFLLLLVTSSYIPLQCASLSPHLLPSRLLLLVS